MRLNLKKGLVTFYIIYLHIIKTVKMIYNRWYVESMDIKFINSNSNVWHKLYDSIRLDDLDCNTATVNIEKIINSSSILGMQILLFLLY